MKHGMWMICADYWALNKATISVKFSIPFMKDLLDELQRVCFFLKKYPQIGGITNFVCVVAKKCTTVFQTHERHYEFLVSPFEKRNTFSTFPELMNDVFKHLLQKLVIVF